MKVRQGRLTDKPIEIVIEPGDRTIIIPLHLRQAEKLVNELEAQIEDYYNSAGRS